MTTLDKIIKGYIDLDEFTDEQKIFITALVKLSFNDGVEESRKVVNRLIDDGSLA